MPRKKREEGTRAPNGASSIYQDKHGKWHGWVTMGVRDNGNSDRRHVERRTENEVIKAVRELEQQRESGKVRKAGRSLTVEQWLCHWVENIAAPTVRHTTMVGYRSSVYKHLIPGLGRHRLDKLQPEHLEALYGRMLSKGYLPEHNSPLKPGTAHLVHRTVRVALNEAVRRKHIVENPAKSAKPPRVEEDEIVPFTRDEAQRLINTAGEVRNGTRYVVALALGLRRGEALGLKWSDIDIGWEHGCAEEAVCRQQFKSGDCPKRHRMGKLTIRRAIQQRSWRHGCEPDKSCGHRLGAYCPQRHGGGIVVNEVKSRSGRRTIGIPAQLLQALEEHQEHQQVERQNAANLWDEGRWVFTNRVGRPVHPTEDHKAWKALLCRAAVRDARLHDARHTAATILLVLKVPLPAVMTLMGWSDPAVAKRYMHVTDEVIRGVAEQVGEHMWTQQATEREDDMSDLTEEQKRVIRQLMRMLPKPWQQRLQAVFPDDDDGPAGPLAPVS